MSAMVIFGSGGRAAGTAAREASRRGHAVTALTRSTGDVTDPGAVARVAAGHDVAVAGVYDKGADPAVFLPAAGEGIVTGLLQAGVRRIVWVGLASLLPDTEGTPLLDTPGYPREYRDFFRAHAAALDVIKESGLEWVAISPSGDFDHGGDPVGGYVLAPGDAEARITYADHALALVDEAEREPLRGAHIGVRAPGGEA